MGHVSEHLRGMVVATGNGLYGHFYTGVTAIHVVYAGVPGYFPRSVGTIFDLGTDCTGS